MKYIEGQNRQQITMFPAVMDDYITEENVARVIDAFVDSLDMQELGFDKANLKVTGRPPYSPNDLLKLYIYGYFNRIRSSRRLETECKRNIEAIWLLKNLCPDHKTISRFRHDNASAIRKTFRCFVKLCDSFGLYGKELLSVDGSKFSAVNSKDLNFNEQKLNERIASIDSKLEKYLSELDENDNNDSEEPTNGSVSDIVKELLERKEKYEGMLNDIHETGQTQVSLTDPDSRRMSSSTKNTVVGYNVQTSVDGKNGLIAEFNVTNQTNDMGQIHDVVIKSKETLEIKGHIEVIADKGYNSSTDMANCFKENITPHVCMDTESFDICIDTNEESNKPKAQLNGRCVYIEERNICICPMGEVLYPAVYSNSKRCVRFYNTKACRNCKCRCTEAYKKQFEVLMPRSNFTKEYNIDGLNIKQIRITPNKELLKRRKCLSEHPFGVVKRCMDASYLLTRGFENVNSEFALAFLVFDLKRAISLLGAKNILNKLTIG